MKNTTSETCPHYLFFSNKHIKKYKNLLKVNPSIKSETERLNLWKSLNEDKIDIISTDHAPHTLDEKNSENPPSGTASVEICLPLMFSQVYENRLRLDILAKTLFLRPSKIANIYPKKGIISKNSDADLVFLEKKKQKIKSENLHTKSKYSGPYVGMNTKVRIKKTILRGKIVYEDNEIISPRGYGKILE